MTITTEFRLDVYTLSVMTVANLILVALGSLFAWLADRSVAGMRLYSAGLCVMSTGALANVLRNLIPGSPIILAGNALTFAGVVLAITGLRQVRARKPLPRALVTILSVASLTLYCWFLYAHDSLTARVAVVSPAYAIFCFIAAEAMLKGVADEDRLVYWPAGFAFLLHGIVMLARGGVALEGGFGNSIFAPIPVQMVSMVTLNLAMVSSALALAIGSNLHLRREAESLALYDPLTHLPNRRLFLERLAQAEKRVLQTGDRLAIVYLDLDEFKSVNDTLGHQAGDDLLKRVATRLSGALSESDCLARIGGDEFVALVENVESRESIAPLQTRLIRAVESETGVSCGLAIFPDDGHTAEAVVREADAAMYQAKRSRTFRIAAAS